MEETNENQLQGDYTFFTRVNPKNCEIRPDLAFITVNDIKTSH